MRKTSDRDVRSKYASVRETLGRLRERANGSVVFTNGCFDLFHPGHLSLLLYARKIAGPSGLVVVGLNDDESVRRLKGPDRPFFRLEDRAALLSNLRIVDLVAWFDEDTPMALIEELEPTIIVKGGDYKREDVVGRQIAAVAIAPYVENSSTTDLIARIKGP